MNLAFDLILLLKKRISTLSRELPHRLNLSLAKTKTHSTKTQTLPTFTASTAHPHRIQTHNYTQNTLTSTEFLAMAVVAPNHPQQGIVLWPNSAIQKHQTIVNRRLLEVIGGVQVASLVLVLKTREWRCFGKRVKSGNVGACGLALDTQEGNARREKSGERANGRNGC